MKTTLFKNKWVKRVSVVVLGITSLFMANIATAQSRKLVDVETTDDLKILKPQFVSVDMAFGNESPKHDKSVILCVGAAFTGERLSEFSHSNIAGEHAGGGQVYKGYSCARNTGAFVYSNGEWKFLHGKDKKNNYSTLLDNAAKKGGCGFAQEMMIYNKKRVKTTRSKDNTNIFRALCDKNGQLLIIESSSFIEFGDFIDALISYGVDNALYLDMGTWSYGWYRPTNDTFENMLFRIHDYHTNWLIFKQ